MPDTHLLSNLIPTSSPTSFDDGKDHLGHELPHEQLVQRTPRADALLDRRQANVLCVPPPPKSVLKELELAKGEAVSHGERRGIKGVLGEGDGGEVGSDEGLRVGDGRLDAEEEGLDESLQQERISTETKTERSESERTSNLGLLRSTQYETSSTSASALAVCFRLSGSKDWRASFSSRGMTTDETSALTTTSDSSASPSSTWPECPNAPRLECHLYASSPEGVLAS